MHFDDRLATVLRLPVTGEAIARIQYRQLIDLLGRDGDGGERPSEAALDAGLSRIESLSARIPAAERARILREPMLRIASAELVARLAVQEPAVATAAIAVADLSEREWLELIPALPVRARGVLRHRRDLGPRVEALLERLGVGDRALPAAQVTSSEQAGTEAMAFAQPQPESREEPQPPAEHIVDDTPAAPAPPPSAPTWSHARSAIVPPPSEAGIGALVRRIEAFRKARSEAGTGEDAPRLPLDDDEPQRATVMALDFATDAEGCVVWADGPAGPGLVGYRLGGLGDPAAARLRAAVRHCQPLVDVALTLSGAPDLSGAWRLDALPLFEPQRGRFAGYAGRLRRPGSTMTPATDGTSGEADRMRQILHELRTPANAIQVAAEIIQQQLYGPAPHEYRALAAAIAGDTAQILAGFEELDRLVRLESGLTVSPAGTCDLGAVTAETIARLQAWSARRGTGFDVAQTPAQLLVPLERDEAARMMWRLLAALAGASAEGEVLPVRWDATAEEAMLAVGLPLALQGNAAGPPALPQGVEGAQALSAGLFGIGFTLRLATAEAAAAGGELLRDHDQLYLRLPRLTEALRSHTQR